MGIYTVHQAKTHFSKLLRKAQSREEVIIANRNTPVAKIVPFEPKKRNFGFFEGQIEMREDFDSPLEDFDSPLEDFEDSKK